MNTPQCLLSCGCWVALRLDYAVMYAAAECEHHGTVSIQKVNAYEWRVRCPDCSFGRWCGQDRELALRRQSAHKRSRAGHAPSVAYDRITWDGGGTILRWDGRSPRRNPPREYVRVVPVRLDVAPPY